MATTVAHGLIGVAVYCGACLVKPKSNKLQLNVFTIGLTAFVANVPDLDMIASLLLFGDHRLLHGALTHSLLFAIIASCSVWLLVRCKEWAVQGALVVCLMLCSHIVVDWLTGPVVGFHPSHGTVVFWPFIDTPLQAPVTLFKGVNHSDVLPGGLLIACLEFLFLIIPTSLIILLASKNRKSHFPD